MMEIISPTLSPTLRQEMTVPFELEQMLTDSQSLVLSAPAALAQAAEGFQSWDVLDAAHMLVASLIVDLVSDNDRPAFLRKMDRILRDRVKEIGARAKPRLIV